MTMFTIITCVAVVWVYAAHNGPQATFNFWSHTVLWAAAILANGLVTAWLVRRSGVAPIEDASES